ncbi:MAG TPA: VOC family protein [Pyrinomonadaceae bacterium]|nr:VOC family protein [Pyrinomonadaceae bacterium]
MAAEQTKSTVIPGLRYRNAPAAIDWLCNVLGFEKQLVVPGDTNDSVLHAQLTLGGGMIMLGSVNDNDFGRLMAQPEEIGGKETQCCYVLVEDADAVYERVKASGVEIIMPIKDEEYGGRAFTCRDLEGHIWAVGTYNPW